MRVYCNACGSKGKISGSPRFSGDISKHYCDCLNVECGHRWVATLAYSHTLRKPTTSVDQRLLERLSQLPKDSQVRLIEQLEAMLPGPDHHQVVAPKLSLLNHTA